MTNRGYKPSEHTGPLPEPLDAGPADNPTAIHESPGRTISFWMSHEEIAALGKKAEEEKVTRNEAGRRAVRAYVGSPVASR